MSFTEFILENWHVRLVSLILMYAAFIDGRDLKVPNWITFPMVFSGLLFSLSVGGLTGLQAGFLGMCVGLLTLLPLYSVGGMGAGDVKLMAGIGAWMGWQITLEAFAVSAVIGAAMAVCMAVYRRRTGHHYQQFLLILGEWFSIRNPEKLSAIAAERKPRMLLLPYGIPICIGTIGYFFYQNMI
jgi:prepilin peptidase CpaA